MNVISLMNIFYYPRFSFYLNIYSETLNKKYIERIHQCRILHFLIMECCRYLLFLLNDYMELFKTVPAYSLLFIYFRKY